MSKIAYIDIINDSLMNHKEIVVHYMTEKTYSYYLNNMYCDKIPKTVKKYIRECKEPYTTTKKEFYTVETYIKEIE